MRGAILAAFLGVAFALVMSRYLALNEQIAALKPTPVQERIAPSLVQSPGFAPAKGYWVEVTSVTQSMETIAIFLPQDTTQADDVIVISNVVEGIQKNGRSVLVFICLAPEDAVFILPNIPCRSVYWFPVTKIPPMG